MSRGIRIGAGSGPAGDLLVTGLFSIAGYPHLSVAGSGSSPPPVNYTASLLTGFFTLTGLPHTSTANKLAFVNTSPLPAATQGAAYTDQLTMSSGQAPFTFTITAGVLPASMSMSGAGLISGTPSVQGTSTFTVQCADNAGQVATQQFSLTVAAAAANLTFTWNPGLYPVSYQNQGVQARGLAAVLASPWYAAVKAEIDQVVANKNGALGFSICMFWTDVDYQGGGVYDWSAVDAIWTYLKTVWPTGRLNVIWQSYRNRANITAASLTSNSIFTDYVIPGWIANAPNGKITVGGTQYTMAAQPNGQYGFFFANWGITGTDANGVANKWTAYALPAIYDPGIAAAYAAAWASGGSHVLPAVTSGGATYGGNAMSAEPYIELTLCQDEYSVVNAGLAASAPPGWTGIPSTGPANAGTAANYFAGTQTIYGTVSAAWGKLTGTCDSFAYIGTTSDTASSWFGQTGYVARRSALRGVALCNADVYSSSFDTTLSWMTSAQQAYIGEAAPFSNSGFVTPTLPGWIGSMPFIAQFEPADFYSKLATGVTARSAATVASLAGAGQGLRATHFLPWITSPKADGSVDITQWGSLYGPAWGANLSAISTLLPTSLMSPPTVTATLSGTSVVLAWATQAGVSFNVYRTTVQGGAGALIGTAPAGSTGYTDAAPPLNTEVFYTAAMTNSNGTGPQCAQVPVATFQNGYDGTLSINASGLFVNGHGNAIELKGINIAVDSQIMGSGGDVNGGDWTLNPGGTYFGSDGPPWPMLARAGINYVRFTLNAAAFMNLPMGVLNGNAAAPGWTGSTVAGDPSLKYKSLISKLIDGARAYGMYWDADLHWTAPAFTFGGTKKFMGTWDQSPFIDYDMGLPFWTAGIGAGPLDATGQPSTGFVAWAIANKPHPVTGYLSDCTLELFNEPYPDGLGAVFSTGPSQTGSILTYQQWMLQGGYASIYDNQSQTSTGRGGIGIGSTFWNANGKFAQQWRSPGYQAVRDGIRALGCNQPLLCNTTSFAHRLGDLPQILPTDTGVNPPQIATAYHGYEFGTSGYPYSVNGSGDTGTNGTASALNFPAAVIAGTTGVGRKIPLVWTEYAPNNGSGSGAANSNFMKNIHTWMDGQPKGSTGGCSWVWNPRGAGTGTGVQNEMDSCYSANLTFSASQAGTTLTVTGAVTGGTLKAGSVLTAGGPLADNSTYDLPYIVAQLTGTAGGAGTYQMSSAQVFGATGLTAVNILWIAGQGQDNLTWFGGTS